MKTKIMIIEDNFYKTFATKQILESQLKLDAACVRGGTALRQGKQLLSEPPLLWRRVGL